MSRRIVAVSGIDPALGQTQGSNVVIYLALAVMLGMAGYMFWGSMQPPRERRRRR